MRYAWFIILIFGLFACGEQKKEVIDINELLPESELYDNNTVDSVSMIDEFGTIKKQLKVVGISFTSISNHAKRDFPDRFGAVNSAKFLVAMKNDTTLFSSWTYKDSTMVMNAFYNWIDCFSADCKSFYMYDKKRMMNAGFELYVSDTTLVLIENKDEDINEKWSEYLHQLGYIDNWNLVLKQSKKGIARWYQYDVKSDKLIQK